MNNSNNSGSLLALAVGLGIGAIAGILLAPAEGAKTRAALAKKVEEWAKNVENSEQYRQIKRVFGNISAASIELYDRIQQEVIRNVEEMRLTAGAIDRQTYYTAVEKTLMTFKSELDSANAHTKELREQLKAEAQRLPEAQPEKKVVKSTRKTAKKAA